MLKPMSVGCVSTERAANRMCSRRRGSAHSRRSGSPALDRRGHAGETGLPDLARRRRGVEVGGGEELRPADRIGVAVLPSARSCPRWAGRPDRPASPLYSRRAVRRTDTPPSLAGARRVSTRRASARPAGGALSRSGVQRAEQQTVSCDSSGSASVAAAPSAADEGGGSRRGLACLFHVSGTGSPHAPGIPAWQRRGIGARPPPTSAPCGGAGSSRPSSSST